MYSEPHTDATDLLDVVAGLRPPRSGQLAVDEMAVDGLTRVQAADLLSGLGVTRLDVPAGTVPGEQRWRLLLARALRDRPRLVLAEGPMAVLDPRAATAILDLLSDVHKQHEFTLLLAVTRLATASYCQRLIRLDDGIVVEDELIGDDPLVRGRVDRIE